jgi:hypothetical protein
MSLNDRSEGMPRREFLGAAAAAAGVAALETQEASAV